VGQTVVVKAGHVLALEAVEGTDEAIRRGARLGGKGAVVVKRAKPGQDERFDLPAVGPATLALMREVGAVVLAVEAGRTVVLDAAEVTDAARRSDITVWGVDGASQPAP
jgi:UDP-2,3-diacylglucosamine hydrolase